MRFRAPFLSKVPKPIYQFKGYEILAIEEEMNSLQHVKQNLTEGYKRELPALTFYTTEHPVLARCLADTDLRKACVGFFDIGFQNKIKAI